MERLFEQSSNNVNDRVGHFDEGGMARPERFERPTLRFVVFSCPIFALFLNVPIRDFSYMFHHVAVLLHS